MLNTDHIFYTKRDFSYLKNGKSRVHTYLVSKCISMIGLCQCKEPLCIFQRYFGRLFLKIYSNIEWKFTKNQINLRKFFILQKSLPVSLLIIVPWTSCLFPLDQYPEADLRNSNLQVIKFCELASPIVKITWTLKQHLKLTTFHATFEKEKKNMEGVENVTLWWNVALDQTFAIKVSPSVRQADEQKLTLQ